MHHVVVRCICLLLGVMQVYEILPDLLKIQAEAKIENNVNLEGWSSGSINLYRLLWNHDFMIKDIYIYIY